MSEANSEGNKLLSFILRKLCNFARLIGGIIFLGVITFTYGIIYFSYDIPDYSSLQNYNPSTITRLYSQDLELLAEYAYEQRIFTKISDVPPLLINAFIAAEDKTFFENYGIDPMGIVRSAIKNISNLTSGKKAIGASTITQQVVQSFIVGRKRTLDRKIAEVILAYRISLSLSKEMILELYLNQIFLGNNSYGVAEAARSYFNKDLSELNLAEAAMIASLPKAPSSFSPYVNPTRLLERRNWVIGRMYEEEMIGEDEMIEFSKLDLGVVPKKHNQAKPDFFYTEEVKKQLIQFYGEKSVYSQGLVVNTNLNSKIQNQATKSLQYGIEAYDKRHGWRGPLGKISLEGSWKDNLKEFNEKNIKKNGFVKDSLMLGVVLEVTNKEAQIGLLGANDKKIIPLKNLLWVRKKPKNGKQGPAVKCPKDVLNKGEVILVSFDEKGDLKLEQIPEVNGAMVVIENYTGKVLGLVGGYNPNATYFNRATQGQRQPGSAFKTIVYLTAVENGFSKDSILLDEPLEISQGAGMPAWKPQNLTHEFNGAVTLQEAFTRSLNMPAIQIGLALGLDKIYGTASKLGIYPQAKNNSIPCKKDEIARKFCTNYSFLLGAFETSLINLTSAYATIASDGYEIHPSLINSLYDSEGNLIYKDKNIFRDKESQKTKIFKKKLIKKDVSEKMLEILQNAVSQQSRELKLTVAGKTGTTNNSFDTWFFGSSKDFTVGVFIGFDLPTNMGKKEIGATVARPVFMNFMKGMMKYLKDGPIGVPPSSIELINTNEQLDEENDEILQLSDPEALSKALKGDPEITMDWNQDGLEQAEDDGDEPEEEEDYE